MKKFIRTLSNQRGIGMIFVVMVLTVLVGGLIFSTQRLFENTVRTVTKQRDRIAALQVLQDFAVLAQKANEVFVLNGNACPPAWTTSPAGFCWNGPFPNNRDCVVNPVGQTNICLVIPGTAAPGAPSMSVAQLTAVPVYDGYFDEMRSKIADAIAYREQFIAELQRQTLSLIDNQAYAIRPEPHLPDDAIPAGPSELTINNIGCGPANPFGRDNCKVCGAGVAQVRCIELRVCVSSSGCANINLAATRDWYRQRVGVIPRF